jgi:hypothetical protein
MPHRATIKLINGANLLTIDGHGEDIDDIDIDIHAEIRLRLDCSASVSVGDIDLGAGLRLSGPDGAATALLGIGDIGLHFGSIEYLALDFGNLQDILDISFSLDRFPLSISNLHLDLALQVAVWAEATLHTPSPFPNIHFDIGTGLDIGTDLVQVGFNDDGRTELGGVSAGKCEISGGIDIHQSSLADADYVLLMPRIFGFDHRVLTAIGAVLGYAAGVFDGGDMFYLSGPHCSD